VENPNILPVFIAFLEAEEYSLTARFIRFVDLFVKSFRFQMTVWFFARTNVCSEVQEKIIENQRCIFCVFNNFSD